MNLRNDNDYLVAITRVNVIKTWDKADPEEYREWVRLRLGYIEEYSANSVRYNYKKPDIWLVMIDRSALLEAEFMRLENILTGTPFKLVDVSSYNYDLIRAIRESLGELEYPCRITTCRFDSDDMLANSFFASLYAFLGKDEIVQYPALISQPGGAVFVRETRDFFYLSYPANPFLSLSEMVDSSEDILTVYCKAHHLIHKDPKIKEVHMLRSNHPLWASVVHGGNVANESLLQGAEIPFAKGILSKRFKIDHSDQN